MINNKIYIGQTTGSISKRWKEHQNFTRVSAVSNAIKKYGKENFEISVIVECYSIDELNQKESFYIEMFKSIAPGGYNLTLGGKNARRSEITKEKLRLINLGKKQSEATKIKRSLSMLGKNKKNLTHEELQLRILREKERGRLRFKPKKIEGWVNPQIGKTVTLISRAKNAEANGGGKYFLVKDKYNNTVWSGHILSQCAKELNLSVGNVSQCLHGKRKQHKGFTFNYGVINGTK